MGHKATYTIGAIITPDGRLVVASEGAGRFSVSSQATLSAETFIFLPDKDEPEVELSKEFTRTLGIETKYFDNLKLLTETETTVEAVGSTQRTIKMYVFKMNKHVTMCLSPKTPVKLLTLAQAETAHVDKELKWSYCSKQMLNYLKTCNQYAAFKGNLCK